MLTSAPRTLFKDSKRKIYLIKMLNILIYNALILHNFMKNQHLKVLKSVKGHSLTFPFFSLLNIYLVDKGYPNKEGYMVPYPRIKGIISLTFEHEPPTNVQESINCAQGPALCKCSKTFGT